MEGVALTPEYRVEWATEVEADDPEAAARLALAIQQSGDRSLSGAFNVWREDDPADPTAVDLFPESPDPLAHHSEGDPSRPIAGDLTCPRS